MNLTDSTEQWCISADEGSGYYGDYPTKDAAIAAGRIEFDGDPFWVGKARPPKPLSNGVYADWVLESAQEDLDDEWFVEWNSFEPSEEQVADLQQRLRAVVDEWFANHGLQPGWFLVDDIERVEP